ncbi:hypothetical protein Bbelb_219940 [Branchiostoma belcheri]|nr:hypothetical protein Bbelb_219940 [Branchiostoma belcheri]
MTGPSPLVTSNLLGTCQAREFRILFPKPADFYDLFTPQKKSGGDYDSSDVDLPQARFWIARTVLDTCGLSRTVPGAPVVSYSVPHAALTSRASPNHASGMWGICDELDLCLAGDRCLVKRKAA